MKEPKEAFAIRNRRPLRGRCGVVAVAVGILLCAVLLPACKEKPEAQTGAAPEKEGAASQAAAAPGSAPLKFDHRVLADEGEQGLTFKAVWGVKPKGACEYIPIDDPTAGGLFLSVTLRLTDEESAKAFDLGSPRYAALSERIKGVFQTRTSAELRGAEAMAARREELIAAVNGFFGATVVRSLYYNQYFLE